ncbi:MAG TPA: xanthine dehydrogenase family protein subunit M [Acidimicrobiales bacterium]|nr:xanthine dehydrogenase family protein subunit M [Acidimicrobiales bacterium]
MQTPAPFEYERAGSVEEAIALLTRHGPEARVIAGGHSLLPMMKLRLARPETLIDINGLADLDYIRVEGNEIAVGAMTRHAGVLESAVLAEHYRIFAEAERVIADPLVRNRGTVGGSLCQADPSEDLSAVFAAVGGVAVIRSTGGTRRVDLRHFHVGPYETAVGDGEILVEVRVPIRTSAGSAYEKVERRAGDWSIAAGGTFVQLATDGTVADVGIGMTAVGAEQFTCPEAEDRLRGVEPAPEAVRQAADICAARCNPSADQRGPVEYKRHLVGVLVARALSRSISRARGEAA